MTVLTTTGRKDYAATSGQVDFPFDFLVPLETDLKVYAVETDDTAHLQTLNTHYSVTGAADPTGGTVTFTTAPYTTYGAGTRVVLIRDLATTQGVDYTPFGKFPANTHEGALDKLTLLVQELEEKIGRQYSIPETDPVGTSVTLPAKSVRSGKFLSWDAAGEPIAATEVTGTPITGFGATLVDDADASAALTTLGLSAFVKTLMDDADAAAFMSTLGITAYAQTLLDDADAKSVLTTLGALLHGQCYLDYVDTTNIKLNPYDGKFLMVKNSGGPWQPREIPSAGLTYTISGLAADTLYYVYVYDNSGTLTIELSTTGHATDSDTGVEIKTGDATRTLVGMARTNGSTQFALTDAYIGVLSYFNRQLKRGLNGFTAVRTATSSGWNELNSEIRIEFLTWGDAMGDFSSYVFASAGKYGWFGVSWNGAAPESDNVVYDNTGAPGHAHADTTALTEGWNYATVEAGTQSASTFSAGASAISDYGELMVTVRG